ncbi:hypothetical protein ACLBZG_003124 [Clostridium perfringens]
MSFFKELKYQLFGTFDDLKNYISIFGNKSSCLSFQHNSQVIQAKNIKNSDNKDCVIIEIAELVESELMEALVEKNQIAVRRYRLDENLNCIGEAYGYTVITDKYQMADIITSFKDQHKASSKIIKGKPYKLSDMITWE